MAPILRIGLTFLIKSREEKNQNPQKKQKIIDSQVETQRERLRHDFLQQMESVPNVIFLTILGRKVEEC